MTDITIITQEIAKNFSNKETANALLSNTFKGLQPNVAKEAMLGGMLRGFTFENFLQKDVYAISYGASYSLVTSIDWARKIAMSSGLAGKDAPTYQIDDNGNVISCSVTVYKVVEGLRCGFTSLVFFKEYSTGKNLWTSKPMTMIAKVAEMHALRMAFPEKLDKAYTEEEMTPIKVEATAPVIDIEGSIAKLDNALTVEMLADIWKELPRSAQANEEVFNYKETLKVKLAISKE